MDSEVNALAKARKIFAAHPSGRKDMHLKQCGLGREDGAPARSEEHRNRK